VSVERIAVGILATWCLSALLYYWNGFDWLRCRAGVYEVDELDCPLSFCGRLLHCFWCVALVVSVPVWALAYFIPWALYPLACAGGAMLLSKGGRIIWAVMQDGRR